MSATLGQFRGRSWSEVVVRQKTKANEILLSEENSYDLLRCRHCKRVIKCGFIDIHLRKCQQHQSNLPKNPSSAKITLAKYYYHVPPIDNSTNPQLSPNINKRTIPEPPHKKRKVKNTNNTDTNNNKPILPPSIRNHSHSHTSIYNDLYRGLKTRHKPKPKSLSKKLKLRFKRSQLQNKHHTTTKNKLSEQKPATKQPDATINGNRLEMTAWEREEDILAENMKYETNINYISYHGIWSAYARTLDKYSMECTTRGNTPWLNYWNQQLQRYNAHPQFRPIIKQILQQKLRAHNQRQTTHSLLEDYECEQDIVGLSYNIPQTFSNGIHAPHKQSLKLRAFIDDGKLQSHLQRDEQDYYLKQQPHSPFKYLSDGLQKKYIKVQQKIWTNKQLLYYKHRIVKTGPIPLIPNPGINSKPSSGTTPISITRSQYNVVHNKYMNGVVNNGYNRMGNARNARYNVAPQAPILNGVAVPPEIGGMPRQASYGSNSHMSASRGYHRNGAGAQYPPYPIPGPPPHAVPSPFVNSSNGSVAVAVAAQQSANRNYRNAMNGHGMNSNSNRQRTPVPVAVPLNALNGRNLIRPPRYDAGTAGVAGGGGAGSISLNDGYNASPSDTQITSISSLTQVNNNNNNPSPQSINSNHTNYTGISQHSSTQMTYSRVGNSNNGNPSHRLYPAPPPQPNGLLRNDTTDAEMYMPSIGC